MALKRQTDFRSTIGKQQSLTDSEVVQKDFSDDYVKDEYKRHEDGYCNYPKKAN